MKRFVLSTLTLLAFAASVWADGVYFKYDPRAFEQQTVVYAALADNNGLRIPPESSYSYYLGAFINDSCRYEAAQEVDGNNNGYFVLRVGGTDNEAKLGNRITFRLYKVYNDPTGAPTQGTEYILDETQYVTFTGDDLVGDLTNPKLLTFIPVPTVMLEPEIRLYRGQTVSLLNYIKKESYETLPVITWDGSMQGGEYYTLQGNNITAVNKTTEPAGVELYARWGNEFTMARVMIDVMATSAVWKDEYRNGLTVPLGDDQLLNNVLSTGFTLTPADASTTFTWTSSNPDVVDFIATTGTWMPKSKGTAKITGVADDASNITLTLDVNVVQPVTAIRLSQSSIYAEVGEDITDRLDALVTVYPQNASESGVKWSIDEDNKYITWSNNRFIASAITPDGAVNTMTVTAKDGYGAHAQLAVNVIAVTPKQLTAIQQTLHLTQDLQNPGADQTEKFLANLKIQPEGLVLTDYNPVFESSNMDVINIEVAPEEATPVIRIVGAGEATITATISFVDYASTDEAGATNMKQLSTTFTVIVQDGLGSFAFDDVVMTRDNAYTLTLKPQPEGSEIDPSKVKVSVAVAPRSNFPAEWTFVEVAPADNSGLVYTLNAKSVGNGTITVTYDDMPMGNGPINVGQRLYMANGWQWIAIYDGMLANTAQMQAAFGDNLVEVRSQDGLMINDSGLGYFGTLPGLGLLQTYKLHLKDVPQNGMTYDLTDDYYLLLADHNENLGRWGYQGWNWIGNPYQYYQSLKSLTGTFQKNDVLKSKNAQAVYTGEGWEGSLKFFTPGEGVLLMKQSADSIFFTAEFDLAQQMEVPVQAARTLSTVPEPWTIDHSQFDDNMAMVARVANVDDPSRVTVWAFVGDECRGRGEAIGDRQYITVHGNVGERVTFRLYDELTGCFHEVYGSRTLAPVSGSYTNPVQLFAGQVSAISSVNASVSTGNGIYDLQGRRVNGNVNKGIYIRDGRKIVK